MDWRDITGLPGKIITGVTDAFGLTDTQAGQRGLSALSERADQANATLNTRMQPVFDMYGQAMQGREMGDVLDTYRDKMMGTEGAASAENVQQFMNPMYNRAIEGAANQALAGAGASLQSSAANRAVTDAVADKSTEMWQTAFNNALKDAQNRQGIYGGVLQSDIMPSTSWGQLTSDLAGTEYTKNMDVAQAAGQVGGQNQSWFGNLF